MAIVLVVGATGLLGSEVARTLRSQSIDVRALVRKSSDAGKRSALLDLGVEVIEGDLDDPASLERACRGVEIVASTVSAAMPRLPKDTLDSVDSAGQLALVDAARRASVKRFVYVSFPPSPIDFKLQRAKRVVERSLVESGLTYVILQPTYFIEVWLSPALGFDPRAGQARVFGDGRGKTSWISVRDVAQCVGAACLRSPLANRTLPLAGPEALSLLEICDQARSLGAALRDVSTVSESDLEAMRSNAESEFDETAAALMLGAARGTSIDPNFTPELVSGRLRTVREHLSALMLPPTQDRP